ncbi:HPP family protein [Prosthecobacter sp.]|uniref:HPP family protein n=1 Tax=Prosthecobacter sp. TaxID=1965333 RepID=UPI003782E55B
MPTPNLRRWLGIELIEVSALEKTVSTLGGGLAILALIAISTWALPAGGATAVITSMGASSVLLFGVPHGQLSQPWPVIAGHCISAVIGVSCARCISHPVIAAACAVGLAIGAMQQLKCIHPPGGATAFTAVMGGSAIRELGFSFVLFPVLTNAVVMVLLAILINYAFPWRRYPNAFRIPAPSPPASLLPDDSPPTHEDIIAAIRSLDSFVDVSEEELVRLVEILKTHPGKSA